MVAALPVPLMPLIAMEFGLDNSGIGFVITSFSIAAGISQIPAGFLADRIGPRTMISISICGIGLSGLLMGLSHNYIMMLLFLICLGIFSGGYHPSAPPLMAASVPPSIRGKALGFHLVGGNAAFFLAPLMAAGIVAIWSWRSAFIILAVPTIIFGIAFYFLLGGIAVKKREAAAPPPLETHTVQPGWVRVMVVFILVSAIVSSLGMSVSSFLAMFAVNHLETSAATAAVLVAVFASSGVWASPFGGHLCDRIGYIPAMLLATIISGPFMYLMTITPMGPGFVVILLIWGALNSIRLPAVESYIVSQASPKRRSFILGIYYATSQHSTGILAPLIGFFFDLYSYVPVMQGVAAISLAIAIIGGIFLWTMDRRSKVKAVEY
jgi:MFS family permease